MDDFIFCSNCSEKVRRNAQYCWKCNADQSKIGPPNWSNERKADHTTSQPSTSEASTSQTLAAQSSNTQPSTSFGRPSVNKDHKKTVKSFDSFVQGKRSEQQGGCQFRAKKKKKNEDVDVTVNIGFKYLNNRELKTVKAKRLPITVSQSANYNTLREKAISKWDAFNRNFDATKKYVLLLDDGSEAIFMPGKGKEFFNLAEYKKEIGKDYKRIVFYLCDATEFDTYEEMQTRIGENEDDEDDDESNLEIEHEDNDFVYNDDQQTSDSRISSEEIEKILQQDIACVIKNEESNNKTTTVDLTEEQSSRLEPANSQQRQANPGIKSHVDVIKELASKVNRSEQFFIVSRRNAPLPRILKLWQRQGTKSYVTNLLRVHYSGEDGIDSGAISLEFLEKTMQDIALKVFPDGTPMESSSHVQCGNFRTCGEIAAVSLAQDGPPPFFLEQCSFDAIYKTVDMMNIMDEHLSSKELKLLAEVRSNCVKHTDLIIDNAYTGPIDTEHIEAIIGALKVSFVSKRMLYMKEFSIGLNSYGLADIIKDKPDECQPLFVNGFLNKELAPDSDYLYSLMVPQFSEEGSNKRTTEEVMMDSFQDTLNAFEDKEVAGSKSVVAWNYDDDCDDSGEKEESAELTIPGLFGWLTGRQHKPIIGQRPTITVLFDHECLKRNPKHSICYPLIGACGRTITLPVAHMNEPGNFKDVFVTAYCQERAFARP